MAERLLWAQPVSAANHFKARQSLIERSELVEILLIYVLLIFGGKCFETQCIITCVKRVFSYRRLSVCPCVSLCVCLSSRKPQNWSTEINVTWSEYVSRLALEVVDLFSSFDLHFWACQLLSYFSIHPDTPVCERYIDLPRSKLCESESTYLIQGVSDDPRSTRDALRAKTGGSTQVAVHVIRHDLIIASFPWQCN